MMLGSKGLLPPTDAHELLRSKLLPQFCKHSESVDLLRKSLLPHVWRVPSSKALSCKHERLFDRLTLASFHLAVNNSHILQIFQLLLPVDMAGTVMPVEGVDSDLLRGSNAVVGGKKAFSGADVIF